MRQDRQDELVSTTAIVAGAVAGIVVTALSLWLHSDELQVAPVTLDRGGITVEITFGDGREVSAAEAPAAPETSVRRPSVPHGWTDVRASARGPSAREWEAIGAFEPIESMTAREPGDEIVDRALAELSRYADDYRQNPNIQRLYLRALRVAEYHAMDAGDEVRAAALEARFGRHAAQALRYDGVVLEEMAMHVQKIGDSCVGVGEREAALRELATVLGTEAADLMLLSGEEAATRCTVAAGDR